jgi:outer membrane protein assembly factor BamB
MLVCPACGKTLNPEPGADIPYACAQCGQRMLGSNYCDLVWIGGGAMGDVYRARRPDMGNRSVAIKIPREATAHLNSRFEREIAASALLEHENIVRAFDRGTLAGRTYLVMEYVNGRSLGDVIHAERPLSGPRVARILRGVALGLAHAQRHGIVNRDIKPENILLTEDDTAKILDYGLAKVPSLEANGDRVTRSGVVLGTPAFMPPEQFRDPHTVTVQADIYALGCTGYCALAGVPPFTAEGAHVFTQHADEPRPSVRILRPDVDPELDALLQRMMACDAGDRPPPTQVVLELDRYLRHCSDMEQQDELDDDDAAIMGEVIETQFDAGTTAHASPSAEMASHMGNAAQTPHPAAMQETLDSLPPVVGAFDDEPFVGAELDEHIDEPFHGAVLDEPERLREFAPPDEAADEVVPVIEGVALSETTDLPPVYEATLIAGMPAQRLRQRWSMPEVVEASALAPPPMLPEGTVESESSAEDTLIMTLPAGAIVDDEPPPRAPEPVRTLSRAEIARGRRNRLIAFATVCFFSLALFAGAVYIFYPRPSPEQAWTAAQDEYQLRKWKTAEKLFTEFAEVHPTHPHAADVPFFLDICQAGRHVFSQTGDIDAGLAATEALFQKYRDAPQYQAYAADFFTSLQRIVERYVELADKTSKPQALAGAMKAQELLVTVAKAMPDDWVPKKTQDLQQMIEDAKERLAAAVAKKEILTLANQGQNAATTFDALDAGYQRIDALLQKYPRLAEDRALKPALVQRFAGEAARVHYVRANDAASPSVAAASESDADGQRLFFVGDQAAGPIESGKVFVAIARGVLYAFDANGNHLWSRPLGFDSASVPLAIPASGTAPPAFIAVSSRDNSLVALAQATGHLLWQYQPEGQDLMAPLLVTRWRPAPNRPEIIRGLLPTASGEIHVLELSRGKRIGKFVTGCPMTVGGTFDPLTKLAYFPAESNRVFAIDPAAIEQTSGEPIAAARAVLLTHHASGSLRSPPVIVGQYLILTEAADLENTSVRAFEINPPEIFPNADAQPLSKATLRGWTWFTPPSLPDRITVVTDEGELGVFGLNLDSTAETLYPLISTKPGKSLPRSSDAFRALAIQSDEYLLWLMAGGSLRHMSLDLLNQRWRTIWPEKDAAAQVTGIPLHEAALDRETQRIYIASRALHKDEIEMTAVAAETGDPLWRRQLGISVVQDPIVHGERAFLLDRSGRVHAVRLTTDGSELVPEPDSTLPPDAAGGALQLVREAPRDDAPEAGRTLGGLLVPLNREGTRLALRRFAPDGQAAFVWQTLNLPNVGLQGRGAIMGNSLVVPCSDGRLHRVPLLAGVSLGLNEQPYEWPSETGRDPSEQVEVVPLSETSVVLMHGREANWLDFRDAGNVALWKQREPIFLAPAPLLADPLVTRQAIFVADAERGLYRFSRQQPEVDPPHWLLTHRITSGPFAVAGHDELIFVITQGRRISCFATDAASGDPPLWEATVASRICGEPIAYGKHLLVTQEDGRISGIRLESGEPAGVIPLGSDAIPSAGAVPFGAGRVLVPLADGTLLWHLLKPTRPASQSKETL